MAEDLLPTVVPGMVGLRDKKTGVVTNHFPVDAREIMTIEKGKYELVNNGAVEAARLNANPLKAAQAASDLIVGEVTGIEGQVLVAMTPEQAEAWKKAGDNPGDVPAPKAAEPSPDKPQQQGEAPPPEKAAAPAKAPAKS